ncbi:MAG: acetate--CoA ligase family protein [Thiolinea sp.]
MDRLQRLLAPRSIAVIGGVQAEAVVQQCQRMEYAGVVWPVHPTRSDLSGLPVFKSLAELPGVPDVAFIGVNRELTVSMVRELSAMGAGGAVCYASGFRESGDTGIRLEAELLAAAAQMPILGPNCYGLINYGNGAALWPDQQGGCRLPEGGRGVAIITQSSNLSINLTMQRRGLPLAYMLTAGNQAAIGLSQLALAVLEDPQVSALGLHIEGFDSIRGMEQVARRSRELRKPVVVLKVGRSEQAQQATLTHTASLAGSYQAAQAFFKRSGLAQTDSLSVWLETLKLLHVHGALPGYRLSSMSCSGGEASLMADAAVGRRVFFPDLSAAQKQPLEKVLGERVTVNHPLDYHTYIWGDEDGMRQVYQAMLEIGFDLNLLVLDFPRADRCDDTDWQRPLRAFEQAVINTGQRAALVSTLAENIPESCAARLQASGIVTLGGIQESLQAAELAADIGRAWQQQPSAPLVLSAAGSVSSTGNGAVARTTVTLTEAAAKAQLAQAGVRVPAGRLIKDQAVALQAAELPGYPLVLKALGIAHKTEAQAVRLNLTDGAALQQAVSDLLPLSADLYVEQMISGAVAELLIGVSRDTQFGLVLTLAAGGVWVELLQDSVTLLLPVQRGDIEQALPELRCYPLLQGYRGQPAADKEALLDTVMAVQDFVLAQADTLQELDINPLMVCAAGQGVYAADALLILAQNKTNEE